MQKTAMFIVIGLSVAGIGVATAQQAVGKLELTESFVVGTWDVYRWGRVGHLMVGGQLTLTAATEQSARNWPMPTIVQFESTGVYSAEREEPGRWAIFGDRINVATRQLTMYHAYSIAVFDENTMLATLTREPRPDEVLLFLMIRRIDDIDK